MVELKVYSDNVDITMTYDATFMLYASLVHGRPIAAGREHQPTAPPVLAGVTVASAAYLEKPKRAAYFIFPDLSVRHEGWYRLMFSLFEGVKHDMDADHDKPFTPNNGVQDPLNTPVRHEGVFNRMDVVSTPFQVFSAKKFPGLNQSTDLSMLVADQGCRVRIRRDVRQRKRRQKSGPEGDEASKSHQGTPQHTYRTVEHSRSGSHNSQYDRDLERRESVDSLYNGRQDLRSRQLPTSIMPMASPLSTPTALTASMPPPSAYVQHPQYPMHRASIDNLTRPAPPAPGFRTGQHSLPLPTQSAFQDSVLPEAEARSYSAYKLPPLNSINSGMGVKSGPSAPRYPLAPPAAQKRRSSPNTYGQGTSLKDRRRPEPLAAYSTSPHPLDTNEPIEADDADADDVETDADGSIDNARLFPTDGSMTFLRADGTTSYQRRVAGSTFRT